jgi:hypothetical protein
MSFAESFVKKGVATLSQGFAAADLTSFCSASPGKTKVSL